MVDAPPWGAPGWRVLPRGFFDRPVLAVAPALLACVLVHDTEDGVVAVQLAEVEAYRGGGGTGAIVVNRLTVVAASDSAAQEYVRSTLESYARPGQSVTEVIDDVAVIGTPDQVVRQLERYAAIGVTHVFARLSLDDMPSEVARATIELMGRDVIPRFK